MKLSVIEAQAKALAPVIRSYVSEREKALKADFDQKIGQMQAEFAQKMADIPTLDAESVVAEVVKQLPEPKHGEDGKSITVEDVAPLLDELVGKAVSELETPVPERGEPGEKGEKGEPGESVSLDQVKSLVDEAVKAIDPPKDGADGRDALSVDVVDLDHEKTYPRGTFAHYRGGVIRSFRTTDPVKGAASDLERLGWAVAMNGVAEVAYEQKGERTVVMRTVMTDGTEKTVEHRTPGMIYRNVYKEGGEYEKGDTTTFGGSLWHADQDNPPGKPGTKDSGWTLAAKRGRDAR